LKLDINKAKKILGWKPRLNLNETVAYSCDWYKTFYEKPNDIRRFTDQQINSFFYD